MVAIALDRHAQRTAAAPGALGLRQFDLTGLVVRTQRPAMRVQIVRRTDDMTGFVVLPRRWMVERPLSWICQRRRCVRDYERRPDNHEAMVTISMTMVMSRRLAKPLPRTA